MTVAQETRSGTPARPLLSVVPTLDEIASNPDLAGNLPRGALLRLHARAVCALAALEGPLLAAAAERLPTPECTALLDAESAAKRLGVPVTWIRDMARQGKLPSVQLGHYVRFRSADLDAFVEQRARAA